MKTGAILRESRVHRDDIAKQQPLPQHGLLGGENMKTTKLSSKGQVILPAAIRTANQWAAAGNRPGIAMVRGWRRVCR